MKRSSLPPDWPQFTHSDHLLRRCRTRAFTRYTPPKCHACLATDWDRDCRTADLRWARLAGRVHRRSRCKLTHQHFRCFRSQHRNGFGALIVSPFLLSWRSSRKIDRREIPELASLFVLLLIVVLIVFAGWFPDRLRLIPSRICVCLVCCGRR